MGKRKITFTDASTGKKFQIKSGESLQRALKRSRGLSDSSSTTSTSTSSDSPTSKQQVQTEIKTQAPTLAVKAEPRFTVAQVQVQQRAVTQVTPVKEEKITKKKFAQRFGARVFDIFASPFKGAAKITSQEATQARTKTFKGIAATLSIQRAIRSAKKKGISQKEAKNIKKTFDKNLATLRKVDPTVAARLRKDPNVQAFGLVTGLVATSLVPVARPIIAGAFKALTVVQAGKTIAKPSPENFADLAVLATGRKSKKIGKGAVKLISNILGPKTTAALLRSKAGRAGRRPKAGRKVTRTGVGRIVKTFKLTESGKRVQVGPDTLIGKGKAITPKVKQKITVLESGEKFKQTTIRIGKGKRIVLSQASIGKDVSIGSQKVQGSGIKIGKEGFFIGKGSKTNKLSNQLTNFIKKQSGTSQALLKPLKQFQKLVNKQGKGKINLKEVKQLQTLSKNQAVQAALKRFTTVKATAPTTARIGERGVQTQGRESSIARIKASLKIQARNLRRLRLKKSTGLTRTQRKTLLKQKSSLSGKVADQKLSLKQIQRALEKAKQVSTSRVTRRALLKRGTSIRGKSASDQKLADKLLSRSLAKIGTAQKSSSATLSLSAKQLDKLKASALFGQIKSLPGFDVTVKAGNKLAITSKVEGVTATDIKQDIIQKIIPKIDVPSKPTVTPQRTKPRGKIPTKKVPPPQKKPPPPKRIPKKVTPTKIIRRKIRIRKKIPKKLLKIPIIPTLPRANKRPRTKSSRRFVGLVKEKGRLLATTREGLTKNRALNDAAFVADNSAAASISIKRSKSGTKIKDTSISSRFRKFRRSKKPGSKLLVERRKHRIDSAGEKRGITAKGLIAKRLKAKMKLKRRIVKKTSGAKRRILKRKPTARKISRVRSVLRGRKKSKRK